MAGTSDYNFFSSGDFSSSFSGLTGIASGILANANATIVGRYQAELKKLEIEYGANTNAYNLKKAELDRA